MESYYNSAMSKDYSISPQKKEEIMTVLRETDKPQKEVAHMFNTSVNIVSRLYRKVKNSEGVLNLEHRGRKRSVILKQRRIDECILRTNFTTIKELNEAVKREGIEVSDQTLRRMVHELGIKNWRRRSLMPDHLQKFNATEDDQEASKGASETSGVELLDIDIKTEAVDYDEDFDREWSDEVENCSSRSPLLTQALTKERLSNGHSEGQGSNGYAEALHLEEELSCHSNASDILSAAMIKREPPDLLDEEDDSFRGRFNLRKRKASLTQEPMSPLSKERDLAGSLEDGEKKRKKVLYNYTNGMMQEALDLVQSQNISIMNAAKQYGIPRSTLRRYALTTWEAAAPKAKNRQEPALTPPEEAHLVSMITKMSHAGKYVSTMDVKSTVQHLLDESQRVVFKDRNRPNAGWVQRFRKRHRNLQIKGSGYTTKRHTLSKQDVGEWYREVTQYLTTDWGLDAAGFFAEENRDRVFNLDEMSLALNLKADLLEENLPRADEDLAETTILAAVSAAGECLQPLIVQKGEGGGHEDDIMPLDQTSYGISFSLSGKMNSDIFLRWLEAFDRELSERGVRRPIALFLDDLFAHFHISVFSYALDHDIILLCVQSQAGGATILQPVEAALTDRVRDAYRLLCKEHYQAEGAPVSQDLFPLSFLRAWEGVRAKDDLKADIVNSFSFMGLIPFDPNALVYADFPLFNEILPKESIKVERTFRPKEPRAKKTLPTSSSSSSSAGGLVPKVKIKKLDKSLASDQHYRIVDGFSSPTDNLTDMDPLSKVETKWGLPPPALKRSPGASLGGGKLSAFQSSLPLERLEGRQDGIKKCIDLMESFIPTDLIPVWRNRPDDLKNSCEIPYCMWRTVHNLFQDLSKQMDKQAKAKGAAGKAGSRQPVAKKAKQESIMMMMSDALQM